ncbi:hypothetical protein BDY17DRAFT_22303 [Neohortaea acidophila]|uniref:Galactose oxidase n=1 Tax=Neohortaea acidophila TaxID=245834 RepID=A0A6A6Q9B2_9PEZI|nr:uncharacterized protein BDY17DRAFT_22303 [Neohortaea acidophila]KAF2487977.1 hypothetical protein BDY17DRAFT_22303 [Neohortaea acidophila]
MAEIVGGVLYGLKNVAEGAALIAKGIYDPTLPLKATIRPITNVSVPLAHHSVSVIKGRAYLFGGKTTGEHGGTQLANSDVHVVILPTTCYGNVDYKKIRATANAPPKRYGHSAAALDDQIYVFGGSGEDGTPLDEGGRVWVYSTSSNAWHTLDPPAHSPRPGPRTSHASVASEHPRPAQKRPREDILPQRPPDPEETMPDIPGADTYGTLFIQGGQARSGNNLIDAWSFDLATRTWKELPDMPSPSSPSPSLSLVDRRLYAFSAGHTSFLDLDVPETGHVELEPLKPWQTLPPTSSSPEKGDPGERAGAFVASLTTGQGRDYLLLVGGRSRSGAVLQDMWTLQLPSEDMSAASLKDAARVAMKMDTREAQWEVVKYYNADGVMIQEGQDGRGVGLREGFAAAKCVDLDGQSVLLWGGIGADHIPRGDGIMVTIEM